MCVYVCVCVCVLQTIIIMPERVCQQRVARNPIKPSQNSQEQRTCVADQRLGTTHTHAHTHVRVRVRARLCVYTCI